MNELDIFGGAVIGIALTIACAYLAIQILPIIIIFGVGYLFIKFKKK